MGDRQFGIDQRVVQYIAGELKDVRKLGAEIAIVIGGATFSGA